MASSTRAAGVLPLPTYCLPYSVCITLHLHTLGGAVVIQQCTQQPSVTLKVDSAPCSAAYLEICFTA